jgi:hypothetical protein
MNDSVPENKTIREDVLLAEYNALYQNFLNRATTANTFWITGFATASAIVYFLYDKMDIRISFFGVILLSLFNWHLAWHLEEIVKLRTYMKICIEDRLGIRWESSWAEDPESKSMERRSRREVILIFIFPYALFYLGVSFLSLDIINNSPITIFNVGRKAFLCVAYMILSVGFFVSTYRIYKVYSAASFRKYNSWWKVIASKTKIITSVPIESKLVSSPDPKNLKKRKRK